MPTRQGWGALLLATTSFAVGRVFALPELYSLGAALLVAVVAAIVAVRRPWPHLVVRRDLEAPAVTVGDQARVVLHIENRSSMRSPRLRVWEPVSGRGGAPLQIAPLPFQGTASATYKVPTARRGDVHLGPLRIERNDPFGFAGRSASLPGTECIIVVPECVPLSMPTATAGGELSEHLRRTAYGVASNEFHAHRRYVAGDDPRRINWKASARLDDLIVRETEAPGVRRCLVVLDTAGEGYDAEGFERAVSAAASIVAAAADADLLTRLVAPGLDLRGPDVAPRALRWLASVERPATHPAVESHLAGRWGADGLGLIAVVTPHAASAAVGAARAACSPEDALVVVTTQQTPHDAPATTGREHHVDCTSLTAFQSNWNQRVLGRLALAETTGSHE